MSEAARDAMPDAWSRVFAASVPVAGLWHVATGCLGIWGLWTLATNWEVLSSAIGLPQSAFILLATIANLVLGAGLLLRAEGFLEYAIGHFLAQALTFSLLGITYFYGSLVFASVYVTGFIEAAGSFDVAPKMRVQLLFGESNGYVGINLLPLALATLLQGRRHELHQANKRLDRTHGPTGRGSDQP